MKKSQKEKQKIMMGVVNKVIEALTEVEGLTVVDGAEILMTCNNIIKERVFGAMQEEEGRTLTEALDHLKKPKILVPGANDINHVKSTKIH